MYVAEKTMKDLFIIMLWSLCCFLFKCHPVICKIVCYFPDMDAKVKSMIKLIEEDADSFAKRAEMYYKKRPELMKLVEEFYRAYRALAERYDHATGVIRHAHRTMAEAFPNQVSLMLDDSPANSASGPDHQTPEMSTPVRAFFEPDELQNEEIGRAHV